MSVVAFELQEHLLAQERELDSRVGDIAAWENGLVLAFLSHRIISKRIDANCSHHLGVFQGIESTGKQ
jgi:hypothetical protein